MGRSFVPKPARNKQVMARKGREKLMINTVTVIGGSGFVGRATVERLARAGKRVIVLCRNSERAKFLKTMGNVGQITIFGGNVVDDAVLEKVIAPADAVVNLVGILAEGGGQRFDQLQGELPKRIGALATLNGVESLVHISAIGANCASPSLYAKSKADGEAGLLRNYETAVVLRPSIVFGPHDDFFNRFASLAMTAPALPLPGGGKMLMQPVFVEDVVTAIMAVLGFGDGKLAKSPSGQIYELGGPDIYSFRQLMEITLTQIQRRRLLVPVPFVVLSYGALVVGLLPNPPITVDQVRLLKSDNIVSEGARTLRDLNVVPTSIDMVLPTYLERYRPGGLFRS